MLTRAGGIVRGASLLAALALLGCASRPHAIETISARPPRNATLAELVAAHDAYAQGLESLSGAGELEIRDRRRGQARRFSVRLLAGRGGRLYLRASVAVVTALEVVADGQRFWLQVPSKRTVWTGPAAARPQTSETSEPYEALRPSDILFAMLPEPLAPGADDLLLVESDRESFSLAVATPQARGGSVRRRVWLERETLRLQRARSYAKDGNVEVDVSVADWQAGLPHRVEVARPLDGYEARFELSRAQGNVPLPERAFAPRVPADYKQVVVE